MRMDQHKSEHSFYPPPNREIENETGWQVSYLDIITLLLASLIIILSITQTEILSPISDYFHSTGDTEFVFTPIEEIQTELEEQLQSDITQGRISIVRELNDLRITFNSRKLYRPGEATLVPEARPLLNKVLSALNATYQYDFNIDVEGHTDNSPIMESPYPSNWELSTARAANVVKYLSDSNIDKNRLKASGYAYSRPLVPNEDSNGNPLHENKAQNRRIVLRIYQDEDQIKQSPDVFESALTSSTNSWKNSNCNFSLQIGGSQTFSNAILAANEATSKADLDFQLTYNNQLFSVRSSDQLSLSEALELHPQIAQTLLNDQISVVHQCEPVQWLHYQIQLGSFQHQVNADRLISRLHTEYNIEALLKQTVNGIKVLTSSLVDLKASKALLEEIKKIDSLSDSFLKYDPETVKNYKFTYQLQLDSFRTERDAFRFIENLPNELNLRPVIQKHESSIFVIDRSIEDWDRLIEIRREIIDRKSTTPIIHLIEMIDRSSQPISVL